MTRSPLSLLILALFGAALAACGGGGGGGDVPPTPTVLKVETIAPTGGATAGGTPVTITGTGFVTGATVTIGGSAAGNVAVAGATSITCNTPPGTVGAADVTVVAGGSSDTLTAAFTYNAPPTISAVSPPTGSTFGGTVIAISGTGFTASGAGTTTVTVAGAAALEVSIDSDISITCKTPGGTPGAASVVVSNGNGTATDLTSFSYYEPLFAAEGGITPAADWFLYAIDTTTGFVETVGPIRSGSTGYGVTGLAFDAAGTLYGTTATGVPGATRYLIQIDPATGEVTTIVGPTVDPGAINYPIPDCTIVGGIMYATDGPFGSFFSVNLATAVTSQPIPPIAPMGKGVGMAVGPGGTVYYMNVDTGPWYTVNVTTRIFTLQPTPLSGSPIGASGIIMAATFHRGALHAIDGAPGPGPTTRYLVTINTGTGAITNTGPALPGGGVSVVTALASRTP